MTHAWPELRQFYRERHVKLVEVDMRWGISEEQSTRRESSSSVLMKSMPAHPSSGPLRLIPPR